MRLEQYLVLNRYMHRLFGAESLGSLKTALYETLEGPAADGQSHFYGVLVERGGFDERLRASLRDYDRRVMEYEARLFTARDGRTLKYFQYLALLYTEIYLDWLTADPQAMAANLNTFLRDLRSEEPHVWDVGDFSLDDLRRVAFFMATGSGKTLLMHVQLWQITHYLEHGRHPEALVQRSDGRRTFDNILLITPGEGLSAQHLEEFRLSGIEARHITEANGGGGILGPRVTVVEIHKLAEEASGGGVSVPLDSLGQANLVFVDEGHKGTGSEAQTWKTRQHKLSEQGFLCEYSATFAQAIASATKKARETLLTEYGKAILFDYSYRRFYDDGYGKDFRVLNLQRADEGHAQELLLGGLLTFYQQAYLYRSRREDYRPYNLEAPLWVFVGSSVKAVYQRQKRKRSDVATVVAFLRRFLEDQPWATEAIRRILSGESGFVDGKTDQDLFVGHFPHLRDGDADALYAEITDTLFRGRGALEVWELKNADGELGLRLSTPHGETDTHNYFGVINIGDVSAFKRHLTDNLGIEVKEDRFTGSLFADIDQPDCGVNVLVGAKKFIEGWSSWRVSTMGLLNIGKGEGAQVIQLFGRGVRLKGRALSLKRSSPLLGATHPEGIERLETLHIFGWNADYVQRFQQMMQREGFVAERTLNVEPMSEWPRLHVPKVEQDYDAGRETWTLTAESPYPVLDLMPTVSVLTGADASSGTVAGSTRTDLSQKLPLLDVNALCLDLLEYKQTRGYDNLFIPRRVLPKVLRNCELTLPAEDLRDPGRLQEAAMAVLRSYLDRFYARHERAAESCHLEPGVLSEDDPNIIGEYALRISDQELLKEIDALLASGPLRKDGDSPLPRLYIDRHLYNPLLKDPGEHGVEGLSVSPPGLSKSEVAFVEGLRRFWTAHHATEPYSRWEVYVLRNLPRVGVGFFHKSGFYPDFILWVKDKTNGCTRVVFIEPHGMHHGGLFGRNADKIDALKALEKLSDKPAFVAKGISLDGYILTDTRLADMPGAEDKSWGELEREYKVIRQDEDYIETLLRGVETGHAR